MKKNLLFALLLCAHSTFSQNLPDEMKISADGRRFSIGGNVTEGFYDESVLQVIELLFDQPDYWQQMINNNASESDLEARMVVNGDTLPAKVGVRFRGQTSYSQAGNTEKKSFNITIDYEDANQDLEGYKSLNLNNAFDDPSFMRETFYDHFVREFVPGLKANYVHLYINGEDWGPYPNIQGLNGTYLKEWFLSNNGTRWRALKQGTTGGPGGGGGDPFNAGKSSLNYLGADTSLYVPNYTLKTANKPNPWDDLVKTCDVLNNTPAAQLEDSLNLYLDLDRTLWYLATEIIYSDDDSYIHKGGMDYYVYWEPETGRIVPLEYDGNSVMKANAYNWSIFYNQTNVKFALMNKLFPIPALRQRYLAHVRSIIESGLNQATVDNLIDTYSAMIDPLVSADTKKIYTYAQFVAEKQVLKNFVSQRRTFLLSNAEVNVQGLDIANVEYATGGTAFQAPAADEAVTVKAQVSGAAGVSQVNLYYATGFVGPFQKTQMFDDGSHGDGAANDGVFGGNIPGFGNGIYVRYYVEAIANNTPKTASYMPKGAEHDVYLYQVITTELVDSEVVINEIMASNETTVADANGQFEDWIELYNNGATPVDLSGWHLSDAETNLAKWTFPQGTVIPGNAYLTIWADEDGSQAGLHANFKLSATGETVLLTDNENRIAEKIIFGAQVTDQGYARIPNGTGDFVIQAPTFGINNETVVSTSQAGGTSAGFQIYPNPSREYVRIVPGDAVGGLLEISDALGKTVYSSDIHGALTLYPGNWPTGVYIVRLGGGSQKLVVQH